MLPKGYLSKEEYSTQLYSGQYVVQAVYMLVMYFRKTLTSKMMRVVVIYSVYHENMSRNIYKPVASPSRKQHMRNMWLPTQHSWPAGLLGRGEFRQMPYPDEVKLLGEMDIGEKSAQTMTNVLGILRSGNQF